MKLNASPGSYTIESTKTAGLAFGTVIVSFTPSCPPKAVAVISPSFVICGLPSRNILAPPATKPSISPSDKISVTETF